MLEKVLRKEVKRVEIDEQGKLVEETTIDETILNKINLYTDIHLYFFTHPIDTEALTVMGAALDKETSKRLFQKYIYEHNVSSDVKVTHKELELLLDSTRKELLNYLRNIK